MPLTLVRCYPIGVIRMLDNGHRDDKIIAIPFDDPNYNMYKDIEELPKHVFDEMTHFFKVYKELENKTTAVNEVDHADIAKEIISGDIERYIDSFCK
jgi:inorganic pyrophosphatase